MTDLSLGNVTNMSDKPNYFSIITADVRYDNRLNDSEKLLFAEITSLTQKNGECWASNEYFANLYDVSISSISRRISKLKKYGYISVEMRYKNGSKEIERRVIKIDNTYTQNCVGGIRKIDNTPIRKIDKDNNTSKSNNTSINKKKGKTMFTPPSFEEVTNYCVERNNNIDPQAFIDFYSSKGWYVGKNKMKDWKASIRTWERRNNKTNYKQNKHVAPMPEYSKDTSIDEDADEIRERIKKMLEEGN